MNRFNSREYSQFKVKGEGQGCVVRERGCLMPNCILLYKGGTISHNSRKVGIPQKKENMFKCFDTEFHKNNCCLNVPNIVYSHIMIFIYLNVYSN